MAQHRAGRPIAVLAAGAGDEWRTRAACQRADPRLFDTEDLTPEAARICRTQCPVRLECLGRALDVPGQHGIRGGLGQRQREQVIKLIDGRRSSSAKESTWPRGGQ